MKVGAASASSLSLSSGTSLTPQPQGTPPPPCPCLLSASDHKTIKTQTQKTPQKSGGKGTQSFHLFSHVIETFTLRESGC